MFAPTSLLILTSLCALFTATPPYFPSTFKEIGCAEQICSGGTRYLVLQELHDYLPPCLKFPQARGQRSPHSPPLLRCGADDQGGRVLYGCELLQLRQITR